jgi:hypothetical protein
MVERFKETLVMLRPEGVKVEIGEGNNMNNSNININN